MIENNSEILKLLEHFDNIIVREIGVINYNIENSKDGREKVQTAEIRNVCEAFEIIDEQKMIVLFEITMPKIKSWQISVKDKNGLVFKYKDFDDVYDLIFAFLTRYNKEIDEQKHLEQESKIENLSSELSNFGTIFFDDIDIAQNKTENEQVDEILRNLKMALKTNQIIKELEDTQFN